MSPLTRLPRTSSSQPEPLRSPSGSVVVDFCIPAAPSPRCRSTSKTAARRVSSQPASYPVRPSSSKPGQSGPYKALRPPSSPVFNHK
jgi:hypothetical protein